MKLKRHYQYIFIYKTTNIMNGKVYVGKHSTNKINDGYIGCGIFKQEHAYLNILFHRAVNKYGYENFKREIIEFIEKTEELDSREVFYISELKSHCTFGGYNMTWGGEGGNTLSNHPNLEKIGRRISITRKENKVEPWNKGLTKDTDIRVKKCSEVNSGRIGWCKGLTKDTSEILMKSSDNHKGCLAWNKNKTKENNKSVEKLSISLKNKPTKICLWCGHQSNNAGHMFINHFDNCKSNPNYVSPYPIEICEYCGFKSRNKGNMKHWHGVNCKYNTSKNIVSIKV